MTVSSIVFALLLSGGLTADGPPSLQDTADEMAKGTYTAEGAHAASLAVALLDLMPAVRAGEVEPIQRGLQSLQIKTPEQAAMVAGWAYWALNSHRKSPQVNLQAVDQVLERVKGFPIDSTPSLKTSQLDLRELRVRLLYDLNQEAEATAQANQILSEISSGDPRVKRILSERRQYKSLGSEAPTFTFKHTFGAPISLQDLRGKVVLLDFFAHWCKPCIAAFPKIRELQQRYKDRGFVVLGVTQQYGYFGGRENLSPEEELRLLEGFIKEHEMVWPVAVADNADFVKFDVLSIPHVTLLDKRGRIRKVIVGNRGDAAEALAKNIEGLLNENE